MTTAEDLLREVVDAYVRRFGAGGVLFGPIDEVIGRADAWLKEQASTVKAPAPAPAPIKFRRWSEENIRALVRDELARLNLIKVREYGD